MIGIFICYAYVLVVLVMAYAIHPYGEEKSRKFVHIMTANWWFIAMLFFKSIVGPLIVSLSFLVVNSIGYRCKIFEQIEVKDRSPGFGTIYYSVSMIVLTLISYGAGDLTVGLVGCLVLGYGDGLAALIGMKWPFYIYRIRGSKKSIGGNIAIFSVAIVTVALALNLSDRPMNWGIAILVGGFATVVEALSCKGRDNLWVPIGSALIYWCGVGI